MIIPNSCVQCNEQLARDGATPGVWHCIGCGLTYDEKKEMNPYYRDMQRRQMATEDGFQMMVAQEQAEAAATKTFNEKMAREQEAAEKIRAEQGRKLGKGVLAALGVGEKK